MRKYHRSFNCPLHLDKTWRLRNIYKKYFATVWQHQQKSWNFPNFCFYKVMHIIIDSQKVIYLFIYGWNLYWCILKFKIMSTIQIFFKRSKNYIFIIVDNICFSSQFPSHRYSLPFQNIANICDLGTDR